MPKPEIKIREYAETDRKDLVRLLEGLKRHIVSVDKFDIEDMKEGYAEAGVRYSLKMVSENSGKIYLAEAQDKKLIGYATVIVKTQEDDYGRETGRLGTKEGVKIGEVVDLFVDENYRNRKIGKELLDTAESYLKKVGCNNVEIGVFWPNENARRFYERSGYDFCNVTYIKKI